MKSVDPAGPEVSVRSAVLSRAHPFAALTIVGFAATAAVVIGILVYNFVLPGPPQVAVPSGTAQPTPADSGGTLERFSDTRGDRFGDTFADPDLLDIAVDFTDGDVVFDLEFAEAYPDDADATIFIVIADPDTVPPDGPPAGSRAPYCSVYEGPFVISTGGAGPADLRYNDWEAGTGGIVDTLETRIDARKVTITIPPLWVAEIRALDPADPRLSFSITTARDPAGGGYDYFPNQPANLMCASVDLAQ